MMKSTETLFTEHQNIIRSTIRRNQPLISALRLETEDVAQDLSIAMLSAIESFDPERSDNLAAHITCKLQFEILSMKRRHKPHGVTGVPNGERINFLRLDAARPDSLAYELPDYDDTSGIEVSELLNRLTGQKVEALQNMINGFNMRHKAHKAIISSVNLPSANSAPAEPPDFFPVPRVRGKYTAQYISPEAKCAPAGRRASSRYILNENEGSVAA